MSNRRTLIFALAAAALGSPFASRAQTKVWRVGYLDLGSRLSVVEAGRHSALMDGLRERGYVEGKNLVLEGRYADGNADRMDTLAAELVRQNVDLIVSTGVASHAAKRATSTIPIVVTLMTDPVGEGLAASLARPGGNITGMTTGNDDTAQKLVELLLVAAPKLKRFAVISNSSVSTHPQLVQRVQAAAKQAGKQVVSIEVRTPQDIERGFATIARERADAVIILADSFLLSQRAQIAALALKHRLPSIYPQQQYAEAGGLLSYGGNFNDNFRRAGIFVDKILKGAKPGDIPFEQPTRYYLVINRKTANALGIKITGELLARADKVIE
jgi:putative tryptophan/tyrosine transport system substrate-binding protein